MIRAGLSIWKSARRRVGQKSCPRLFECPKVVQATRRAGDVLLTEQGVFIHELEFAAAQANGHRERHRRAGGLRVLEKGLFKNRDLGKWNAWISGKNKIIPLDPSRTRKIRGDCRRDSPEVKSPPDGVWS